MQNESSAISYYYQGKGLAMNYKITFQYAENIYCTNIVASQNKEDAMEHYRDYRVIGIKEATDYDLKEAERKGMPFIDLTSELEEEIEL